MASSGAQRALAVNYADDGRVLHVVLNRPEKRNALNAALFREIEDLFTQLARSVGTGMGDDALSAVRAVVLSGSGHSFCAGIDLQNLAEFAANTGEDAARTSLRIRHGISIMQACLSAVERCPVPVIAAVHGLCIGAGVDLVCCTDMRLASSDAVFSVKEVDLGIAADLGTLQRLPRLVRGQSVVREWVYTARDISAAEAAAEGFVLPRLAAAGGTAVTAAALAMAAVIAAKSPVAVHGTKFTLGLAGAAEIDRGLNAMQLLNGALLQSDDVMKVVSQALSRRKRRNGDGARKKGAEPIAFSKL